MIDAKDLIFSPIEIESFLKFPGALEIVAEWLFDLD
jgi:hypothetical protein